MKRSVALLIVALTAMCFALEMRGDTSGPDELAVIWAAPSNHWPATVWTYKVVPQEFAPEAISNLMALGVFTMADRTNTAGQTPFRDERILYFRNPTGTKYLGIFGSLGWIEYKDSEAVASMDDRSPATVPTEDACYQLALDWLPKLGIDRTQLATAGNSEAFRNYKTVDRRGWFDKDRGTNMQEVILRGVSFIRRVDGIDFDGIGLQGGVSFKFGNDGRISKITLVWRNMERFREFSTLTADEMTAAIRSGKTKWQMPRPKPNGIKKITITGVMPLCRGKNGDEEQDVVEPYARIATLVDYGHTNVIANLECPILGAVLK